MADAAALLRFAERASRLFVLTGAGCSTASGIPDYRDENGDWKRRAPVQYLDFVKKERTRRHYWSRSLIGWPALNEAEPNDAHRALAALERHGPVRHLVTQNVDGLHQKAGSQNVLDLHGRLDDVVCLTCQERSSREAYQRRLESENPAWRDLDARIAPDGDADLDATNLDEFRIPACEVCDGVLKPDVVFFGESVPKPRVEDAYARLDDADGVLVVGSSLMVFSGFRFAKKAAERRTPIAIVNQGTTRADDLADVKIAAPCGDTLTRLAAHFA